MSLAPTSLQTPTTADRKKQRKKWIKWAIITLLLLAVSYWIYQQFKPTTEAPNYITATAQIGDIENNVMASGKVKAINTVNVGAQVSGEVTRLYVNVGDEVEAGDLIAQIDQVTQQNNVSNQEAALRQSEATLQSAKAEAISRQAGIGSAEADYVSRQAELRQAQNDLSRLASLLDMNAISQQEFDLAQTQVDTARARVANAEAAIYTAQSALVTAQSNITSREASLQQAQTDLDTANENLGYTTIHAPIDGTVVSVTTEQGATVNAMQSAPTIVTLADLSTVRINSQISEADVVNVEPGMPVYFNIIGNPDEQYDAVLEAIEPAPENMTTSSSANAAVYYIGYIEVPNPDRRFRIDMTAQVFIVIDEATDALLIPSVAIKQGPPPQNSPDTQSDIQSDIQSDTQSNTQSDTQSENQSSIATSPEQDEQVQMNNSQINNSSANYVRVLNSDDTVTNQSVQIGIDNRVNAQVIQGLQAGDEVIISEESADSEGGGPPRL